MAQGVQDSTHERIEIVDQLEDINEQEQKRSWLPVPIALVIVVALFFLVRRFAGKKEF
jgi:hypothetical protein